MKMTQTAKLESTVEQRLENLFDSLCEGRRESLSAEEYEQQRHDFAFHMTDWKGDLVKLASWFRRPESLDDEESSRLIVGFLYHVIPHLNRSGQLLLEEIPDPFSSSPASPT